MNPQNASQPEQPIGKPATTHGVSEGAPRLGSRPTTVLNADAVPTAPAVPAPAPRKALIKLDHVTKQFGDVKAVEDVTFEVYEGEIFGFIGPSGSGKTTTMRLINGIFTPTAGKAMLLGANPAHPTRRLHEGFGYLPQLFVLYKSLSVYENMSFVASVHGLGWRERGKRIKELLDFVEMWGSRNTLAGNVSGGMQRRLELAAALMHNPQLLFADEPTAGIDPVLRGKFWEEFRRLRSAGHTLFVTTQYVGESEYCDRVGVISRGKLIAIGTPLELRRSAFNGDLVDITAFESIPPALVEQLLNQPFVMPASQDQTRARWRRSPREVRLNVQDAGAAIPQLVPILDEHNVQCEELQEYRPSFDDVFIALLGADAKAD